VNAAIEQFALASKSAVLHIDPQRCYPTLMFERTSDRSIWVYRY